MTTSEQPKLVDAYGIAEEKGANYGMSNEAKEEFGKRLMDTRKLGKRTAGFDDFFINHPKGKEIIILAMGPTRGACPFDAEVWGLNTGWKQALTMQERLDKLFIVHKQVYSEEGNPYFEWDKIRRYGCELVLLQDIPEARESKCKVKLYPIEEIQRKFDTDYFTDTICYQIAYALHKYTRINKKGKLQLRKPLRLKFYGVDIQDVHEYWLEKGGVEYWLGRAQSLGVEYFISFGSTLLTTETHHLYGMDFYDIKNILPEDMKVEDIWMQGRRFIDDATLQQQMVQQLSGQFSGTDTENR